MRKLIATLLAVSLAFSSMDLNAMAAQIDETKNIPEEAVHSTTEETEHDGTHSGIDVGELSQWMNDTLYSSMQEEIAREVQESAVGCYITAIERSGDREFSVTLGTQRDCSVLVAVFDENNIQFLGFGQVQIQAGQTEATVVVDVADMPQYFYIRGWLVDTQSLAPFTGEYESSMYTQAMQELMTMTTEEFTEDRVVNLDKDVTTNFMILKEDVLRVSQGGADASESRLQSVDIDPIIGERNELVNFDPDTNTFEFRNCDSEFLQSAIAGRRIAYEYDTNNFIYIEVRRAMPGNNNSKSLTIVAKDTTDIQDFLEYIKLDKSAIGENAEVDLKRCDALARYEGMEVDEVGSNEYPNVTFKYTIKKEEDSGKLDETKPGDAVPSLDGKFNIEFACQISSDLKYYMTPEEKYFQISITHKETIKGYFEVEGEIKILLGDYTIPFLAGGFITLDFPLRFVLSGKAEGNLSLTTETMVGFKISNNIVSSIKESKAPGMDINVEMNIFVGLEFEPTVSILFGLMGELKISVTAGLKIDAKDSLLSSASLHHDCTKCIEGHFKAGCEIKANIKIAMFPKLTSVVGPWEFNLLDRDWYNDICHSSGFCLGKCPYSRCEVHFVVKDEKGFLQKELKVEVGGMTRTTDEKGKCSFWLYPNSDYHVTVKRANDIVGEVTRHVASESTVFILNVDLSVTEDRLLNVKKVIQYAGSNAGVSAVIASDDALYLWGNNTYGQLGNGTTIDSSVPVKVLDNVKDAKIFSNAVFAVTNDGELYSWGRNISGVLGTGDTQDCHSPYRVTGDLSDSKVDSISLHASDSDTAVCAAITSNGNLYMWGSGKYGLLGTGEEIDFKTPQFVMSGVKEVYAPATRPTIQFAMFALTETGSLYSWGYNHNGILGTGSQSINIPHKPEKVMDGISSFSWDGWNSDANYPFAMATAKDGSLYMWGSNLGAVLGQGDGYSDSDILSAPAFVLDDVKTVRCNTSQTSATVVLALQNDGDLYQWGSETSDTANHKPVLIAQNVRQVYGGYSQHVLLDSSGELYAWSGRGNVPSVKVGDGGYMTLAYSGISGRQCYWAVHETGKLYSYYVGSKSLLTEEAGNITGMYQMDGGWYNVAAAARGADATLYLLNCGTTGANLINITEVFQNALAEGNTASVSVNAGEIRAVRNPYISLVQADGASAGERAIEIVEPDRFTGLVPQRLYEYYVVKDVAAEEFLTADNILYIGQEITDAEGNLALSYVTREEYEDWELYVVEMAPRDISRVDITAADLYAADEEQYADVSVIYRGERLEAGVDYVISGDYVVQQAGTYSVTVTGIGLYEGTRTLEYHVWTPGAVICSVRFLDEKGELLKEERLERGQTVAEFTAPEVPGYHFVGWYLGDVLYDFDTAVTEDMELHAHYERLKIPVTGISLNYTEYMLSLAETGPEEVQLTATLEPENADYEGVFWTSGDETLAVVSGEGLVRAVSEGTVEITATAGSCNAVCVITVIGDNGNGNEDDEDGDGILDIDMPQDGKIPDGLWIAGIDTDGYEYTGAAVKPEFRVYDGKVRLKEGRDYTVKYTRNKAAYALGSDDAGFLTKKAPTITVKGKGNYAGTQMATFKIRPKNISDDSADITVGNMVLAYNQKTQKPNPVVKWGDNTLKKNRDYTVSYNDTAKGAYREVGSYSMTITGKGNYSGERNISFEITSKMLITKAKVGKIANQTYTGAPIEPVLKVTYGKETLTAGKDYIAVYISHTDIGTATVRLIGMGDYAGEKTVTFKIVGIPLSKAKVNDLPKSVVYTGEEITKETGLLPYNLTYTRDRNAPAVSLVEGVDYQVSYTRNIEAGTAAVIFQGMNGYSGTVKKTFRITPYDILEDAQKVISIENHGAISVSYEKGGSKPEPVVRYRDRVLTAGRDYTVSYKNNTVVNDRSDAGKIPKLTIKGKGSFKGSVTLDFIITAKDIGLLTLAADDKAYTGKRGSYSSIPVIYDTNGKKLTHKTDFTCVYTYTYDTDVISDGTSTRRTSGDEIKAGDVLSSGTSVTVTATGKNQYYGTVSGIYRIVETSISKAKVMIPIQYYTGAAVEPGKDSLTVKLGQQILKPENYEIIGYENNIKTGTAKMTIRGIGNYGGIKTVSFQIKSKKFVWWWNR